MLIRKHFSFPSCVICSYLDCLDKTTALRSVLSLTQRSAPTLAPAEAEPRKRVIWQSFGVKLVSCSNIFPILRSTLSLSFLQIDLCALLKVWFVNSLLQICIVQWVWNELVAIPMAYGGCSATRLDKRGFLNHFLSVEATSVVFWK